MSVPLPAVAGSPSWLWTGPLKVVPAGSVTHEASSMLTWRSQPEKSSFAVGSNSKVPPLEGLAVSAKQTAYSSSSRVSVSQMAVA